MGWVVWLAMFAGAIAGAFAGPMECPRNEAGDKLAFAAAAPFVIPAHVAALIYHGQACKPRP